mmetsp:Transcript_103315/g.291720  ORF Transcript_103315/g.291720 Transcript_103315/m.291720 type:complete len:165 (-) Transcript_103315:13-507(-)
MEEVVVVGAVQPGVTLGRVEVRLTGAGAVARRAVLAPLLRAADVASEASLADGRGASNGETRLAELLLLSARAERKEWLAIAEREGLEAGDARVALLAHSSATVLGRFSERLEAWLAKPTAQLMVALARGPSAPTPAPGEDSSCNLDTSSSEDDGSPRSPSADV